MAQTKQSSRSNYSCNYSGEGAVRQANVLASCYIVDDNAASLRGFHYCTTALSGLPSPPSSPPLAAITATNELALLPKKRSGSSSSGGINSNTNKRRGGATLRIREECERLFCETMKTVFLGERGTASNGSSLASVYYNNNNHDNDNKYGISNGQLCTPPDEQGNFAVELRRTPSNATDATDATMDDRAVQPYAVPTAWLELWDYAGGASFRAVLVEDVAGDKSLFAFFDAGLLGRDLKQALMALIELADSVLGCAHLVVCVDRIAAPDDATTLVKGLQWAGFSLTTLDTWTGGEGVDVTSPSWLFMGMEL
ncbi:ornithine decarboxylase antizyme [Niveomyces insectorum RCEF 264]|uniref:Ornithine decarboxylase antizyme n=1 Tax=Niveomyces insectorum RCEF 264 TaxID=1081102 RepID=A0A162MRQ6_9HYPO|nr:ornithine decarboxylase antizyme [Niveomyces insectorum RCEF 264]